MKQPRMDITVLLLMIPVLSGLLFIGFISAWWYGEWGEEV